MRTAFTGTGVALATPFGPDLNPDLDALRQLVRYATEGGVDYLVVLGTTAEVVTLNQAEKALILQTVADENNGRLPLVAGIGGNNTLAVAWEMEQAPLDAYQAILSVSPYYNRPTQEGIYQHFKFLASRSPLPLILYNVPARTGSNMLPETVARLARDCEGIIGVKEACGDMGQVSQLLDEVPDSFLVISGDDFTAVPTVLEGGVGVISVLGQALPATFSNMINHALDGNRQEALALSEAVRPLTELIFAEGNPAGIKALLSLQGIGDPYVRLPLVPASEQLMQSLEASIKCFDGQRV